MYTILAESKAGKKRFDHHVDFVTKYPLIHLPGMRHADKNLDDFVEQMLEKIPKQPEPQPEQPADAVQETEKEEKDKEEKEKEEAKPEVPEAPKAEELAEALQAVVEGEVPQAVEKPKKHKHKSKSHKHRSKKASSPKIDADLVDDGEEEPPTEDTEPAPYKRKFSTVVHEPYESEVFRIFNNKQNVWFSGGLHNHTAIEGTTIKLICTISGPRPMIKWFKEGRPVPWSATIRNMSSEGIGYVIIEKIARADAGVYSCVAKNDFNEVTAEAIVKVIPKSTVPLSAGSKPMFTRVLGEFYHNAEDDLILDAHVRAVPVPTIVWYKDGIELNAATDKRFDFTTDHDGGYQLRINKPKDSDSGLFACEAVNSEGKAKVIHKVNFTELERHTHPQFLYHKETFWQPTLRMEIEPEPEIDTGYPDILHMGRKSGGERANVQPTSQDTGSSDNQQSSGGGGDASGGVSGGSGTGGDGNEEGEGRDISKDGEPADGDDGEEKEKEKKPEEKKRTKGRKRYEGTFEPLLIRDSVS